MDDSAGTVGQGEHPLRVVVLGPSITSSRGNGHAATYRGLLREMARRGHEVLFLERDAPWYAGNRDVPSPGFCRLALYESVAQLRDRFAADVREADFVIVGSHVPEGVAVGEWVTHAARGATAFYDLDTPATLASLARGDAECVSPRLIPEYDAYLSCTGGPALERLEREYGSPMARPLYGSVDPALYYPEPAAPRWDLAYGGTYGDGRQPALERLLVEPARQWARGAFAVLGRDYPPSIVWPANVERVSHLSPSEHRAFYNAQRFALDVTRADAVAAGWSPSVRLFEAAACGTPIVSDGRDGLDSVLAVGSELFVARSTADALAILREVLEPERCAVADRARVRVLAEHTAAHRAAELEGYALRLLGRSAGARTADRTPRAATFSDSPGSPETYPAA